MNIEERQFITRTAYAAALYAQIVSLEAREKEASGFVLNTDMHIECALIRAQIKRLHKELEAYVS